MSESRWRTVEQLLDEAVEAVFPSAQCIVVDGGREVFARAVGACTDETIFDIASLTKALSTTTLCMQLVEEGRLSLDEEARPGVRVHHLLEHASGLPAWMLLHGDDLVEVVRHTPLDHAPGTIARYSDLGFILLGGIVAARANDSLDRAFASRIAQPLGLHATYGPVAPDRCAVTEGELRGVVHDENARHMGGVAGHAGLFSTARDVSRIAASLVGVVGVPRLVGAETVARFWTPSPVPGSTWCLGWDRPSTEHSSAGARWPRTGVGHLGFTGCSIWIDPARLRWVILLSNRVYPTRANEAIKAFRPRLHDAIVAALD